MHLQLLVIVSTYALLVQSDDVENGESVESQITKEAAKQLRSKLNGRGGQQDADYDEILKGAITGSKQYNKKYFDYLPNDLDSDNANGERSTDEFEDSFNDDAATNYEYSEDVPSRFKRDIPPQNLQQRVRRQKHSNANPYQNRFEVPIPSYSSNPWSSSNNPNQRFHPPYNHYLPALPGNNNPSPPDNPNPSIDTGNRIAMFEEDDRPVWGSFPASGKQGSDKNRGSGSSSGSKYGPNSIPQPTQRPQIVTTTQKTFVDQNNLGFDEGGIQSGGFEIELPVADYDEPLTTRAPLRKASRKPNKKVTTTTARPARDRKPNKKVSPCVLAIVNCCSRYDTQDRIRIPCFEQYKCSGAFFGKNPCSSPEIKAAAFREVGKFAE